MNISGRGRIELIIGPMFAGKSTELLRRVRRLEISGKKCLNIKYTGDNRYANEESTITTHDKQAMKAVAVSSFDQIGDAWRDFDVISIDEGQFYEDTSEFADRAANNGKIVIVSALNGSYEKQAWQQILNLIPLAEEIIKLTAVCTGCGQDASFSHRIVDNTEKQLIGGPESYIVLCRECFNEKNQHPAIKPNVDEEASSEPKLEATENLEVEKQEKQLDIEN